MNLKHKTDVELLANAQELRREERDTVAGLLHYLIEIERRDLHLARGFSSLNVFLQQVFGYSKDEASFRISAMRLLRAVPEAELELRSGRISLSHLARTQRACKKEDQRRKKAKEAPLTHEEKLDLLETMKNKTTDDVETLLANKFPELNLEPDVIRQISATHSLIKFHARNELVPKLKTLFDLLAHKNFDRSLEVLIDVLAELGLDQFDPRRRQARREKRRQAKEKRRASRMGKTSNSKSQSSAESSAGDESWRSESSREEWAQNRSKREDISSESVSWKPEPSTEVHSQNCMKPGSISLENESWKTELSKEEQSQNCIKSEDMSLESVSSKDKSPRNPPLKKPSSVALKNPLSKIAPLEQSPIKQAPAQNRPQRKKSEQVAVEKSVEQSIRTVSACEVAHAGDATAEENNTGKEKERENNCDKNGQKIVPVRFRSSPQAEEIQAHVAQAQTKRRPYQKISLRDAIYSDADGQCEYVDPVTKTRCTSRHATERDHIIGFARGGSEDRENYRLLCRAHNQFEARQEYGDEKTKRS